MITKNQFKTVDNLLSSGMTNYVQIRQQAGLTSEELDDIIDNRDYYRNHFATEERLATLERLNAEKRKKHWWQK